MADNEAKSGSGEELTKWHMYSYGFPSLAKGSTIIMVAIFISIFYESLGANLGLIGFFIACSNAVDIANDPFIAYLTDSSTSSLGRRKPFIVGGGIFYIVTFVLLWIPPDIDQIEYYFAGTYIWFFIGVSLFSIPYNAMGPELSLDQNVRGSLFSVEKFFENLGWFIFTFFPPVLIVIFEYILNCSDRCEHRGDKKSCENSCRLLASRYAFAAIAIFLAIYLVVTVGQMVIIVKEGAPIQEEGESQAEFVPGLLKLRKNYPFMMLLIPWALDRASAVLHASLVPFFVYYVLDPEGAWEDEGKNTSDLEWDPDFWLAASLGAFMLITVVTLPIWACINRRFGKRFTWLLFNYVDSVTHILYCFTMKGQNLLFLVFAAINGIPLGGQWLSDLILADTIEYEELLTGRRAEGSFTMMGTFIPKIVSIPATVIPLVGLVIAGFVPSDDGDQQNQPESVKWYLIAVFGIVPFFLAMTSVTLKQRFPFRNAQQIDSIRDEIEKRRAGSDTIVDPITYQPLIVMYKPTPEEKENLRLVEYFPYSSYIQRIIEGKFETIRKEVRSRLICYIVLTLWLIGGGVGTFQLIYVRELTWVPTLWITFVGVTVFLVIVYGYKLSIANQYRNFEFDLEFLKLLKIYYENLEHNENIIRSLKYKKVTTKEIEEPLTVNC